VFPAHVYRVQIGGEQIFLVNVHLRPPIEKGSGATLFSMVRFLKKKNFFCFFP
jgi:hypothetical protein